MAREDDLSPIPNQMLDGGHCSPYPGIISDLLILTQRHIEIGPHEHLLPFQIRRRQIAHALLRHRHHPTWAPAVAGPHFGSHVECQERVRAGAGEAKAPERGQSEATDVDAAGGGDMGR